MAGWECCCALADDAGFPWPGGQLNVCAAACLQVGTCPAGGARGGLAAACWERGNVPRIKPDCGC